jgi:hypothetical protein
MNYQQLNCSISLLISQGFVKRYDNPKSKRFSITPSGNRTSTFLRTADLPAGRQVLSLLRLPIPPPGQIFI